MRAGTDGVGHPNERDDRQCQMGHVLKRYQFRTKLILSWSQPR